MSERSCKTCAYHSPSAKTLDDAPSVCWPCADKGGLPGWTAKPTGDAIISTTRRITVAPEGEQSGGLKFDTDKPRLELLDRAWLEQVASVLGFGAKKYAAHNWRKGLQQSRLIGAALRHLHAHNSGEDLDPESGLPHLAHASCCLMFATGMMATRPDMDDRYKAQIAK